MATRSKTDVKRDNMKTALRARCRDGVLEVGRPIPGVRELAEEFGMSKAVAGEALRDLVSEGLLYSVPRVGVFVQRAPRRSDEFYLFVTLDKQIVNPAILSILTGFENSIARHGGVSLVMDLTSAKQHRDEGELPPLSGVFDLAFQPEGRAWMKEVSDYTGARVRFHVGGENVDNYDEVSFDDFDGGRQATRHLIEQGHRKIAFLALHANPQNARLAWSQEREDGWRAALEEEGIEYSNLAWHPRHNLDLYEDETKAARDLAQQEALSKKLEEEDISAVVAANDHAAAGLMEALKSARVPHERWPAIVGFDGDPRVSKKLVTSLRLSWDEVGHAAGDLLWERSHGLNAQEVQHRRVAMRLIPRLTTRRNWSSHFGHVALAASAS